MRAVEDLVGLGDGGLETKTAVDEVDVIINGLGDTDDGKGQTTPGDFIGNGMGALERAVPADAEQDVDLERNERVHHLGGILHAARGTEDRAAVGVDVLDVLQAQELGRAGGARDQAGVAVADTIDLVHAIPVVQFHGQGADDIVEAGAEPAAGDNGGAGLGRIKEDRLARAGLFESPFGHLRYDVRQHTGADAICIGDEMELPVLTLLIIQQRRRNAGWSKLLNDQFGDSHLPVSLRNMRIEELKRIRDEL